MNSSDTPSRIVKAFAVNGLKNVIPTNSSSSTDNNGVATFEKGFPAITMQPLSAGGIPPSGKDVNGVIYSVTLQQQWQNAGMTYPFNQSFSDSINGYPKGAIVPSSTYTGQWLNLNESNITPPESPSGSSTGWVPINNYGVTHITMGAGSVVMSSLQAAKDRIILTGTLTANVNLIFPSWIKSWTVSNNCTGNFNITCRTSSGSGVVVIPGLVSRLFCDGVNISDETYNPNNDMVGAVVAFAMNSAPEGWLIADGSQKSRVTYARLFSRIGTIYGVGDGSTTFNVPDGRANFIRGADNGRGVDAGRVFGSYQADAIINITGAMNIRVSSANSGIWADTIINADGALSNGGIVATTDTNGLSAPNSLATPRVQKINFRASDSVPTATETRPKNLAMLYCIKY